MPELAAGLRITVVEDYETRAQCLRVRREVFVDEQDVPADEEADGLDDTCIHLLATEGAEAIGAARIRPLGDIAKIQRVCVRKSWRGTGAGAKIMLFAIDHARQDGRFSKIALGAQLHAIDFYRRLGFSEYGDDYFDAGIAHRNMELRL